MLSAEEREAIDHELELAGGEPGRVVIDALMAVQRSRRWVSDETLAELAEYLGLSIHALDSVATFYNHVLRKPVGRHVIRVCDSISCYIMGYESVREHLIKKLGIRMGETTADERFTLLTIPCLGACDRAPAMMVDEDLHGPLTPEAIDSILESYS